MILIILVHDKMSNLSDNQLRKYIKHT